MRLAIFDLDNTLLNGDSDYSWGCFLVEKGIVDRDYYEQRNAEFYRQYQVGKMDIFKFLEFSLQPLVQNSFSDLHSWRAEFMQTMIEPMMLPKAQELIAGHRDKNDTLLIITATNRFITEPIASRLGVPHLLATDPEIIGNKYTGQLSGVPCYQGHKVTKLKAWLAEHKETMAGSTFYSDSLNDIPLLEWVDFPVAVDPDEHLAETARQKNWPIISLR